MCGLPAIRPGRVWSLLGVGDESVAVLPDQTKSDSFTDFVNEVELRLRQALTAALGPEDGREAAAEALTYAWQHWERVGAMENSAGYLYRVGQSRGGRMRRRRRHVGLPPVTPDRLPWVEPGLPAALARLSDKQRTVVLLLHSYEWTMSEVAELLGVSKATVQSHADRAMRRLRERLRVSDGD